MTGKFHPTTTPEEARALTVGCLQAIAAGWSLIYMRPARIQGISGNQSLEPDLDRMIGDAADMAARITQATAERVDSGFCPATGSTHTPAEVSRSGAPFCSSCGKGLPK